MRPPPEPWKHLEDYRPLAIARSAQVSRDRDGKFIVFIGGSGSIHRFTTKPAARKFLLAELRRRINDKLMAAISEVNRLEAARKELSAESLKALRKPYKEDVV